MSIDTLEIARRLADAGFSQTQAEAVSKVLYEQRAIDLAEIATKTDLATLRADLATIRADVAHLASKSELAEMKYELTWRVIGITATMNGILFALLHFVR